jgi:hypothetical protein
VTEHVVRVGTLRTDVAVVADAAAVAPLRRRLDRTLSELLPRALAELSGPVLDRYDGVVRLRRLRLTLDHTGPFTEAALARLLAVRIAAALSEALARPGGDVRVWENHAAYLATYVEALLGLDPGPSWPFADLSALAVLSPAEAAVEVLRTRPAVLTRLASNGAGAGNPARLLARLDDRACAALVDAVLDGPSPGPPRAADIAALRPVIDVPVAPASPTVVPRVALTLLLRAAARRPGVEVGRLGRAAVAVSVLTASSVAGRHRLTAEADARELAAALTEEAPSVPARLRAVVRETLAEPEARTALAGVFGPPPAARTDRGTGLAAQGPATGRASGAARLQPGPRRGVASPVAGVALLLPGAVRYGLHRTLTAAQLRAAVLSTLGEEARRGAVTDPFLAALLPADPHADIGVVPPVPVGAQDGLRPESRHLLTGAGGAEGWGGLLLADLAGRLPGLARSSAGYLRRQFLHTPGRLDLTDVLVAVTLDGPALAVVLAMAGFRGDQGPLPHLDDRRLTIELTGLRP